MIVGPRHDDLAHRAARHFVAVRVDDPTSTLCAAAAGPDPAGVGARPRGVRGGSRVRIGASFGHAVGLDEVGSREDGFIALRSTASGIGEAP